MAKSKTIRLKTRKTGAKLPRSVRKAFPNVKTVVDATQPIEIAVEAKDCKGAVRMNPSKCALARAARRELKAEGAIIGMSTSYLIQGDKAVRFHTPASVRTEIVSFDRHDDFEPGEYYLIPKSPTGRFGRTPDKRKDKPAGRYKRKHHHSVRVRVLPKGAEQGD
jgi:hypothetical protein